jgi:hypothetical protein
MAPSWVKGAGRELLKSYQTSFCEGETAQRLPFSHEFSAASVRL